MPNCIDHDFPCQFIDYSSFDKIANMELKHPVLASEIVNSSWYCMHIPTNEHFQIGDLLPSKFLRPMRGKSGLYHLWKEYENCDDHKCHTMECQYVGKGPPDTRVSAHIKNKWNKEEMLYVTFNEFDNRLAKYYEQLFLDTYKFELNNNENNGAEVLYAVWDEERVIVGTHLSEISSYSTMQGPEDW
ncbi:hypothetical protein [Nisaea nitritireducens]|uniref:hypothetical protein n=1 Tax=Nisaea nitritireducens TaxID=568392 RepID=UPI00186868FE|nr:hypothetical protein [Nisaea nitritireducens]